MIPLDLEILLFKWLNIGLQMRLEVYRLFTLNLNMIETSLQQQTQMQMQIQTQMQMQRDLDGGGEGEGDYESYLSLTPLQIKCKYTTSDNLEMVKATAEAGQNLLHIKYYKSQYMSIRDKLTIADEIYHLLEGNVKQCCHKQQYQAVDIMLSQLHLDMGLMLVHNNYIDSDISRYVHVRHKHHDRVCDGDGDSGGDSNRQEPGQTGQTERREHNIRLSIRHFDESIRILENKPDPNTDTDTDSISNTRRKTQRTQSMSIVENTGYHLLIHPYSCIIPALETLGLRDRAREMKMRLYTIQQAL